MSEYDWITSRKSALPFTLPGWVYLVAVYLLAGMAAMAVAFINEPKYLILAAIALPAIAVIFFKPEFGLWLLLFLGFTRTFEVLVMKNEGALSPFTAFLGFMLLVVVIRRIFYGEKITGWETVTALLGAFFVLTISSALWARYPDIVAAQDILFVKDATIAFLIVILMRRATTLRQAVWALLAAGIFLGGITVIQQITHTSYQFMGFGETKYANIYENVHGSRVGGPGLDPNAYSQFMLMLLPLAWDRFWAEKKLLLRGFGALAFGLIALTVVFSYSRANFLALVIVGFLLWLTWPNRLTTLLIGMVIIALMLPFIPQQFSDRLSTLKLIVSGGTGVASSDSAASAVNQASQDISFRGRLSENLVGIMMSLDHPILGVGYGNFKENYQSYSRNLGLDPRTEPRSAHNLYLETFAELGILGLFWFFLLQWATFRGLANARKIFISLGMSEYAGIPTAMIICIVGYLVTCLFLHMIYPRYVWIFYGLALAIPHVANEESDRHFSQPTMDDRHSEYLDYLLETDNP